MAKGYVNLKLIKELIAKSRTLRQATREEIIKVFIKNKIEMIAEFDNHPVTKEIEEGITAKNGSKTLSGYGNLFSFIGFNQGETPIQKLRDLLIEKTDIDITPEIKTNDEEISYMYLIILPNQKEIEEATQMPWENGKSWALSIEKGISGFSNYVNGQFIMSRSDGGIQSDHIVDKRNFKPVFYLTEIFKNFERKFRNS